jgi:hypothetical protein
MRPIISTKSKVTSASETLHLARKVGLPRLDAADSIGWVDVDPKVKGNVRLDRVSLISCRCGVHSADLYVRIC